MDIPDVSKVTSKVMIDMVTESIFSPSIMWSKPEKYYYEPVFIFKIPYLYFDKEADEWGEGRRGLFIGWHDIGFGKRKMYNENYKEEMKRWKKQRTIMFKTGSKLEVPIIQR